MIEYTNKITALYSRLSVGDEDRDGGESNSIVNQKAFLERYARQHKLMNIRHYIDDDESGRFFDRSAYTQMISDVESGKIGIVIMKDMTRWGRDYLQVGNAMEIFRRNNVRFIAINNGIDSQDQNTLEFAPFINIMSEWYARDISKKVKTGIKTKGASGKPVATEAPYGYIKDPNNKDFWVVDKEAAEVIKLIFTLFMEGKNRNQIAVYLKDKEILTPTFYMKQQDREKQINLVREYVKENFVKVGMCADIALHDKNDGNPHAHILLTMRPLNEDTTWGAKSKKEYILDENGNKVKLKNGNYKTRKINTVDWNEQDKAEQWRKAWADITNKYLEKNSIQEKVDHRSYQRQGIEQIPTIHLGVSATQMEKKGIATDRGNINREIKHQNMILREISRRIKALLNWIRGIGKEEKTETDNLKSTLPSKENLLSVFENLIRKNADNHNTDLEQYIESYQFLKEKNIISVSELKENIVTLRDKNYKTTRAIKDTEKEIDDRVQLINQAEKYLNHKDTYKAYTKLKKTNKILSTTNIPQRLFYLKVPKNI